MVDSDPLEPGPAALGEAKAWLRVETAGEDGLIGALLRSAAELCERFTGRAMIVRGHRETLPAERCWQRLTAAPVVAIGAVEGLPRDGPPAALAAGAYSIDIDAHGEGWVRVTDPGEAARIKVTYQAGLAAGWETAPAALRQGIVRLAAHFYAHREAEKGPAPPASVTALWRPWRRLRLGGGGSRCSNG